MESRTTVILETHDESSILIQPVKCVLYNDTIIQHVNRKISFRNETICQEGKENVLNTSGSKETSQGTSQCLEMLCRVCANSHDHLVPIFGAEGVQHKLIEKIHKYLPIQVSMDERLPHQLCYNCAATIVAWHNIIEGCSAAQEKLQRMRAEIDDTPSEMPVALPSRNKVTEDAPRDTAQEVLTESVADKNGDNLEEAKDSINTDRSCGNESGDKKNGSKRESDTTIGKRKIHKCLICNKSFSTSYNFFIHKNTHTGAKPYKCNDCDKSFSAGSALNRHRRLVHSIEKNHACEYCDKAFACKMYLDEHKKIHGDNRLYNCEICEKTFKQKSALYSHKQYHAKHSAYKCEKCLKTFYRVQDLKKHSLIHTDEKPHFCTICGKKFRTKGCVSRHSRIHVNQKQWQCNTCHQKFSQDRYLKNHIKTLHQMEK